MYDSPEFHIMMIMIWKNKTIAVLRSEPVSGKAVCDQQALCYAELSLDVDADRDGIVEKNNPKKVI